MYGGNRGGRDFLIGGGGHRVRGKKKKFYGGSICLVEISSGKGEQEKKKSA